MVRTGTLKIVYRAYVFFIFSTSYYICTNKKVQVFYQELMDYQIPKALSQNASRKFYNKIIHSSRHLISTGNVTLGQCACVNPVQLPLHESLWRVIFDYKTVVSTSSRRPCPRQLVMQRYSYFLCASTLQFREG